MLRENLKQVKVTLEYRKDMQVTQSVLSENKLMNEYRYKSVLTSHIINYEQEINTGSFETEHFICEQYCYIEIDKQVLKSQNKDSKLNKWIRKEMKKDTIKKVRLVLICFVLAFCPILIKSYISNLSIIDTLKNMISELDTISAIIIVVAILSFVFLIMSIIYVFSDYFDRIKKDKLYFKITKKSAKKRELLRLLTSRDFKLRYGISELKQKDKNLYPMKSNPPWENISSTNGEVVGGPPYILNYNEEVKKKLSSSYEI